jgi:hypothetical protein
VSSGEPDEFAVLNLVERLAAQIETTEVPFAISLSGDWGIGKSTIAYAVVERMRADGFAACYVDAWSSDSESLRHRLVIEVGAQMLGGDKHKERVAKFLDRSIGITTSTQTLASPELRLFRRPLEQTPVLLTVAALIALTGFVTWLIANDKALTPFLVPVGSFLAAGLAFLFFGSGLVFQVPSESSTKAPATEEVELSRRFEQIVAGNLPKELSPPSKTPTRVLIVVDNLDRLQGDEALRVLASMRALMEISASSRCAFLVPVDRRALARHLRTSLADEDRPEETANDYLEKLFNLDMPLTQPELFDVRGFAANLAARLFPDAENASYLGQIATSAAPGSPRAVQRILNGAANRWRILNQEANLAHLVLIEGLIERYPNALKELVGDTRRLDVARDLATDAMTEEQREHAGRVLLPSADSSARCLTLAEYLRANAEIRPTEAEVLTALSLREDRFWRGISSAEPIWSALQVGDAEGLQSALADREDAETALERAIEFLEKRSMQYSRDAMLNINAIAPVVKTYEGLAKKHRRIALDALGRARLDEVQALRREAGEQILLDPETQIGRLAVAHLVELATEAAEIGGPGIVVFLLRQVSDHLDPGQLATVRSSVATYTDEEVAVLFDAPVATSLIEEELGQKYVTRLADAWTVDSPQDLQGEARLAAERLSAAQTGGWRHPELLARIAETARTQLARGIARNPDSTEVLAAVVDLLRSSPDPVAIDALAGELAAYGYHGLAIRLEVQDPIVREQVRSHLDAALATLPIDEVRPLVTEHEGDLGRVGSQYLDVLADRWLASDDADALELRLDIGEASSLVDRLSGQPPPALLKRGAALVRALQLHGQEEALVHLIAVAANGVEQTLTPPMDGLGEFIGAIRSIDTDATPISKALASRANSADANSFRPLLTSAEDAFTADRTLAKAAADGLAVKAVAMGIATLGEAKSLVVMTHGARDAGRALAGAMRTVNSATEIVAQVSPVRGLLNSHSQIRLAMVELASQGPMSTAIEEVRILLKEADLWKKPKDPSERNRHDQLLEDIARTHPSLAKRVSQLKVR